MRHVELGHDLLKRVLTDIEGISSVEQEVQFEGRQLITVVAPKHN
jgi:Translation initiation factor 3 (IF-3)